MAIYFLKNIETVNVGSADVLCWVLCVCVRVGACLCLLEDKPINYPGYILWSTRLRYRIRHGPSDIDGVNLLQRDHQLGVVLLSGVLQLCASMDHLWKLLEFPRLHRDDVCF